MRPIIIIAIMMSVTALKAQTFLPFGGINNNYRENFLNKIPFDDSVSKKNWSLTRYSAISSSFTFFKGGNATIISAPMGLQLNRKITNNLFAFAGVSLAPAYLNFNRTFMANDFNKTGLNNTYLRSGNLGLYSRAELGLQYTNDERTFSISGSIGVERSNFPVLQYNQPNNANTKQVFPSNR